MEIAKLEGPLNDAKTPAPKTAILWGRADLLGEAVESILTMARSWQVVKIMDSPDMRALSQAVEKIHPEIVIINQSPCTDGFFPPIQLIEAFPELRVITVNPDNNVVEVYNKQEIRIKEAADLLSIIAEYPDAVEGGEKQAAESQPFNHFPDMRTGNMDQKEIKNDRS
jgi:hypothetical protein